MIRACIIGISGFGNTHYNFLVQEIEKGHMQVLGATVINQDEEKEKCSYLRKIGCELFTDYRKMLACFKSGFDLCFIPTSIHLHATMTIAAMQAGANVYVEKPIAATIQEVHAIQAVESQTKCFVAVGYQTMYAQETLVMKKMLCEKRFGKVLSVKYWGLWPRLDSYYARNKWAGELKSGKSWVLDSPINNALAHQLNMICFLAGSSEYDSAQLTSVQAELYRAHSIGSADTVCLRIRTANGPILYTFVTHCSAAHAGPEIEARCEHGTLRWVTGQAYVEHEDGRIENIVCDNYDAMRQRMIRSIMERIRDSQIFVCGPQVAKAQILAVNGAHESSTIHTLDPGLIERKNEKNSVRTVIKGIDSLIHQCFKEEKLFSEMKVHWARANEVFVLDDYYAFTGGKAE